MQKTITILMNEFNNNIINSVNTSNLPISVVKAQLENVLHEVNKIYDEQLKADVKAYNESVESEVNESNG